jgi:hypothetical protein
MTRVVVTGLRMKSPEMFMTDPLLVLLS